MSVVFGFAPYIAFFLLMRGLSVEAASCGAFAAVGQSFAGLKQGDAVYCAFPPSLVG